MSTLTQFLGGGATTSVVNLHSSGGGSTIIGSASTSFSGKEVLSGALTANTLATALSVSGGGAVPVLVAYTKDATARTVRLKVTADGVSIFDATSASLSNADRGIYAAGQGSNPVTQGEPIVFNSSLTVEIASSLTETDKVAIAYVLNKR